MKNILFIIGTRPEAIKVAPVILEFKKHTDQYRVYVCNTEQQKQLTKQTLKFFGIQADINLDVMTENQTLSDLQARIISRLHKIYNTHTIDLSFVQGDTMSAFSGALVSFYHKVPVAHIEAGLRSYKLFEPFPEEAMRQMLSRITDFHFAPTNTAQQALEQENIPSSKILITGNTVIDALFCLSQTTLNNAKNSLLELGIALNEKLVLITVHRRENHGDRLSCILSAVNQLAHMHPDHQFVLPVHPNPNVNKFVFEKLGNIENVALVPPLDYPLLVTLMKHAKLILTDSGGIQEEAPTFGVPVLVMRYETERREGINANFATLVGADTSLIIQKSESILKCEKSETRLDGSQNPYGDGKASCKILSYISAYFKRGTI